MNRRTFLSSASLAAVPLSALRALAAEPAASQPAASQPASQDWQRASGLRQVGSLKPRSAKEIAASRVGVGMECLDRRMYRPEKTYAQLAALGAKWARLQTGWARCETTEGVYDFAWLDEVVDAVIAAGVKPWFNVGYGNRLYSPDAPHESAVGQVPLYDGERGVKGWESFLRALGQRYKDRIEQWEIWNEPNISSFWHPKHKSSPVEYAKLVEISARAIRQTHPKAQIAACISGMSPDWIEKCLQAGMGPHIHIFSIHPYNRELIPELNYASTIARIRSVLSRLAPHVRLWQGECGAPAQTTGHHDTWMRLWNMNERNQAKWVVRRIMLDLFLDLDLAQYFHLCDLMEAPYRQANGQERPPVMLGLLHGKTYTPKLAYAAMQSLATLLDDQAAAEPGYYCALNPAAGQAEPQQPYTMLFRRAGQPLLAYYQAVNVQDDAPAVTVDVEFSCDGKAADILRQPVLVDPISQAIFAIENVERKPATPHHRPAFRFRNLPCLDYPLLITDKRAIS